MNRRPCQWNLYLYFLSYQNPPCMCFCMSIFEWIIFESSHIVPLFNIVLSLLFSCFELLFKDVGSWTQLSSVIIGLDLILLFCCVISPDIMHRNLFPVICKLILSYSHPTLQLLMMKRGGELIYAGPLGPNSCKLIDYFQVKKLFSTTSNIGCFTSVG